MTRLATNEQDAAATAAWARARGLSCERYGLLPPVAPLLKIDPKSDSGTKLIGDGPGRWTENLCAGDLPGGIRGSIGHHTYLSWSGEVWDENPATVTVATVLEGTRIARGIRGESHPGTTVKLYEREHGPLERAVGMPDGRFTWTVPVETDEAMLWSVFDGRVVEAIRRLPDCRYDICQREGSLSVALIDQHITDPTQLDTLCELTAALAAGMRRVAAAQRPLRAGDALPEPVANDYRRWVSAGAARVPWRRPPDDLESAVAAYRGIADADPGVGSRRFRVRVMFVGFFALIGLLVAVPAALFGGALIGLAGFILVLAVGVGLAAVVGAGAGRSESSFRSEAWGLDAFGAAYASWRGYRLEDPEEFCKRFTMPLFGSPQRVMRGEIAPGVDGRLIFWRDRNEPGPAAYVNVALAAGTLAGSAQPPFGAIQAGDWVVVYEMTTRPGRSIARLDAVAAEAARLAAPLAAQRR